MKKIKSLPILLFLFAFLSNPLFAQDYTNNKNASKKVLKFYNKGKTAYKAGDIEDAIQFYQKAIAEDERFIDAYVRLGDIYVDKKKNIEAIKNYQKVVDLSPTYALRLHYALGYLYFHAQIYNSAIKPLEYYIQNTKNEERRDYANYILERVNYSINAIKNPVPFSPQKLPPTINTSTGNEYLPSFTADGIHLIYTAVRNGQEDFYFSEKVDGQWQQGRPLIEINTKKNEGAQAVSADGRILVFTACNRRDGFGSCDLYISYKDGEYWTPPVNMGRKINTKAWESQPSLSAYGDYLYFASTRPGGYGGSDIYVSKRLENGMWSDAVNLGAPINTKEKDQGPFIHADGRTLYFSSSGHPGMGGLDLFKTTMIGDQIWDKPQNLGYPVNTIGDENTLTISLDGTKAFMSSDRIQAPEATVDIYEFELYEAARPNPVTFLKATVVDAFTKVPLQANTELFEYESERTLYLNKTTTEGSLLISLEPGKTYGLNVEKEGYLFHSEYFDLKEVRKVGNPYHLIIELQPVMPVALMKEGTEPAPVVLKNIFFETGSAELLETSTRELNKLYSFLNENPSIKIRLDGHTDDVGEEDDNLELSRNRAKAVYHFLVQKGIKADRLSYRGYGESTPIDTNETKEGRRNNRRTEFLIIQ